MILGILGMQGSSKVWGTNSNAALRVVARMRVGQDWRNGDTLLSGGSLVPGPAKRVQPPRSLPPAPPPALCFCS